MQIEKEQIIKYKNITIKKKPGTNLWWARARINGKIRAVYSTNQKECYNKLKELFKEQNTNMEPTLNKITLIGWFNRWLEVYKINSDKKLKDTTINDYKRQINHIKEYHGIELKRFNNIMIKEMINKLPTPRTRQKLYEILKTLFKKAFTNDLIKKDPMLDMDKPIYKAPEKHILSEQKELEFIEACKNNKYGDFFLICLYQGLRRGECLALKPEDINLKEKMLTIDESINNGTVRRNVKNKNSLRQMPIFERSLPILEKYSKLSSDERIFNVSIKNIDKHFRYILNEINVKDITIHSLRHQFITECMEKQIPEHIVQLWVGHAKDSKVTKKVYTHIRQTAIDDAVKLYNEKTKD